MRLKVKVTNEENNEMKRKRSDEGTYWNREVKHEEKVKNSSVVEKCKEELSLRRT